MTDKRALIYSPDFTDVSAVPCAHIAAYYELRWQAHKCIAWQCLRRGYRQWAEGRIESFNNLFDTEADRG